MTDSLPVISRATARRLFLHAQGLIAEASPRRGGHSSNPAALQKVIEGLGFVQLDSINVVERAHHLTLSSRLVDYNHDHFRRLLEDQRTLFEHWTHDASAIPVKWFPHWKPRFGRERERLRSRPWWRERLGDDPERTIALVLSRIRSEGPLRSQDFEDERRNGGAQTSSSAWWGWKPQKAALEYLWSTGELMTSRRVHFQKFYDLTERVLPAHHDLPEPSAEEHIEWACRTALERLVIATPREISAFWNTITQAQAKAWCEKTVVSSQRGKGATQNRVIPVWAEGASGSKARLSFAVADWEQRLQEIPEAPSTAMRLLCPFDPVLRDRQRARRLFDFDYRFEAFVPGPKRVHGYYVLPILEGERLVGRVDPKFNRRRGVLEIRRVYWEDGIRVTARRRRELKAAALGLARLIGASDVELPELN